jgi:hypothetical protein
VAVLVEAGFDEQAANDFIAHKAGMKAPLTARAWADHLTESRKAGWSPSAAADKVMARSWKGFDARYVANEPAPGRPASQSAEPAWRAEQRERNQAFFGAASAKRATPATSTETIDVTARIVG